MSWLPSGAEIIDRTLEGTIVASFTRVGYDVRRRVGDWAPLPDLTGQHAIITGATSGIGNATASGLLELGANVAITSRSLERAEEAAGKLNQANYVGSARGFSLDTSDFDSVRQFANEVTDFSDSIDMLLNNAGALTNEYQTDGRGMELTLSSHLVGPYLLTKLLRPHLTTGARVVFMSSGGMYTQGLDVDTIEMSPSSYKGATAYARAKRGQVELVTQLASEWAPQILLHSMHPGWVDTPGVDAALPGFGKVMGPLLRDAEQGADTMVWLAATGGEGAEPGQFWLDRTPRGTAYLPGTGSSAKERARLVEWLEQQIAEADAVTKSGRGNG